MKPPKHLLGAGKIESKIVLINGDIFIYLLLLSIPFKRMLDI